MTEYFIIYSYASVYYSWYLWQADLQSQLLSEATKTLIYCLKRLAEI